MGTEEEKNQPSYQQERLNTENYNDLVISTAEGGENYVFVSYKSQDYDQVFSIMAEMQNRYGLRIYYDKAFDKNNNYWMKQMLSNLSYPICSVMLCFISEQYLSSYATLIELLHSQVGDDYGESIPVIPIFLEPIPLDNGEEFKAFESRLAKNLQTTGLPSDGPERTLFNELFEKMVAKFQDPDLSYDKNVQTVDFCKKMLQSLEKGTAPNIDTRFAYRLFKEVLNALHCNQFHLRNYEINMDQFYVDFAEKITSAAGMESPFGEIPEKKVAPVEKSGAPVQESVTPVAELVAPVEEAVATTQKTYPSHYEVLEPHEYVMEDGVLITVTTQKPYIILPEGAYQLADCQELEDERAQTVFVGVEEDSNTSLEGVVIPDSVRSLGRALFYVCINLKEVVLPQGIEKLPDGLFFGCTSLERYVIPESVNELGEYLFSGCTNLKEVVLSQGIEKLPMSLFRGCTSLERIVIPESVKELEKGLFLGCTNLKEVVLSQEIEKLPMSLFKGCTSLERIVLPDSVKELGADLFSGCTNLKEVVLPQGIEKLPAYLFSDCTSLERFVIPDSVKELGKGLFLGCTNLKEVVLPQGIEKLPDDLFSDCTSLKRFVIPNSVKEFGEFLFSGCRNLKKVVLPQGIEKLPTGIFNGCTSLDRIVIRDSVKE